MLCPKCSSQLNAGGICPNCGYQDNQDVQTMSRSEAHGYSGVTIEEEGNFRRESAENANQQKSAYYRQDGSGFYRARGRKTNIRFINLGTSSNVSWLTKGLIALGGAAVLAFFFFVALPVLLTLAGVGIVAWIIFHFFRR